jgi:hypothetical protein
VDFEMFRIELAAALGSRDRSKGGGQVRLLLDERVGDAVTFALPTGAVRSA